MSNLLKPELFVYIINVCSNGQVPENWTKALQFADILKEIIDAMSGGVQPGAISGLPRTDVSLFLFRKLIR